MRAGTPRDFRPPAPPAGCPAAFQLRFQIGPGCGDSIPRPDRSRPSHRLPANALNKRRSELFARCTINRQLIGNTNRGRSRIMEGVSPTNPTAVEVQTSEVSWTAIAAGAV